MPKRRKASGSQERTDHGRCKSRREYRAEAQRRLCGLRVSQRGVGVALSEMRSIPSRSGTSAQPARPFRSRKHWLCIGGSAARSETSAAGFSGTAAPAFAGSGAAIPGTAGGSLAAAAIRRSGTASQGDLVSSPVGGRRGSCFAHHGAAGNTPERTACCSTVTPDGAAVPSATVRGGALEAACRRPAASSRARTRQGPRVDRNSDG